jgi:hypothetical protein
MEPGNPFRLAPSELSRFRQANSVVCLSERYEDELSGHMETFWHPTRHTTTNRYYVIDATTGQMTGHASTTQA